VKEGLRGGTEALGCCGGDGDGADAVGVFFAGVGWGEVAVGVDVLEGLAEVGPVDGFFAVPVLEFGTVGEVAVGDLFVGEVEVVLVEDVGVRLVCVSEESC